MDSRTAGIVTAISHLGETETFIFADNRGSDYQWQRDSFGINVARAKVALDNMIEYWHESANGWACGRQDFYGDQMDAVAEFCGYRSYMGRA